MKKNILTIVLAFSGCSVAFSQSAIDAYRISQPDMKGTARYMGMAGAFGALGGDLSAISVNPGGIGVYRNGDVGFTIDLDCQSSDAEVQGMKFNRSQTKFLLNNIGAVLTMRLPSRTCPNLNFGFTYNKGASFNRVYGGNIPKLYNSMSNYIAGISNGEELTVGDVTTTSSFDPYNPISGYAAPWISILGYDSYLINPKESANVTQWYGQWGDGTSGSGAFAVRESGGINEYNIVLGGNISNVLYWGMNFDIVNLDYTLSALWGENLTDAYVPDKDNRLMQQSSVWSMDNIYNVNGTGFKYELGVIVKPIQELRLGLAFHTPTWYNLTENYGANVMYEYGDGKSGYASTNNGLLGYNDVSFRTPWKFVASIAGVIGNNFILSFDYEWTGYEKMRYSLPSGGWYGNDYGYWDDPWWDWGYMTKSQSSDIGTRSFFNDDPYYDTNNDITTYYRHTNTFRLGAEYRISSAFSVRAGYSNVSSPVRSEAKNGDMEIYTSGTLPNYRFDNSTNYATAGIGWRYKHFYADLAYVYKHMSSTYHAYTSAKGDEYPSPTAKLSFSNNQIVLSAGFRF